MIEQVITQFFANKTKFLIRFETSLLCILGILTILFPSGTEIGFNYVFATLCIIFGIAQLFEFAKKNAATTPATEWLPFITALTAISVGAVMYIDGMMFLSTFLSIWLFTFGIFQIIRVFSQYKTLHLWGLTLFCGAASLFFAVVMRFNWPISGIENVGYFVGPNLIIAGITVWFNNRAVFTASKKKS